MCLHRTALISTDVPTSCADFFFIFLSVQNRAVDQEKNICRILARDENFNCLQAHWTDLHSLIYNTLPPEIFFGVTCTSLSAFLTTNQLSMSKLRILKLMRSST